MGVSQSPQTVNNPIPQNLAESKNTIFDYPNLDNTFTMVSNIARHIYVVSKEEDLVNGGISPAQSETIHFYGYGNDTFKRPAPQVQN